MSCWLLNIWLRIQDTEDGSVTLLRNVGNYLSVETASHPRRPESFLFMFSTKISYSYHFAKECDLAQISKCFWIQLRRLFFLPSFFLYYLRFFLYPPPSLSSSFLSFCLLLLSSLPTCLFSCYLYCFLSVNLSLFSSDLLFSFDAVDSLTLICSGRHYKELSGWR